MKSNSLKIKLPSANIFNHSDKYYLDEELHDNFSSSYLEDKHEEKVLNCFEKKISDLLQVFFHKPLNKKTLKDIKEIISQQIKYIFSNHNLENFDIDVKSPQYYNNDLAKRCVSYNEYSLRNIINHGKWPSISEEDFYEMRDSEPNTMKIEVRINAFNPIKQINLNLKIQ